MVWRKDKGERERRAANGIHNKKQTKFPMDGERKRTKFQEKESTLGQERRLRKTRKLEKESHAYTTSEENTIWNLLGQNEGPLFSALHILILKTLEALLLMEQPQQPTRGRVHCGCYSITQILTWKQLSHVYW